MTDTSSTPQRARKAPAKAPSSSSTSRRKPALAEPSGELTGTRYELAGSEYVQTRSQLVAITTQGAMQLVDGVIAITCTRDIRDVARDSTPGVVLDSVIEATYTDPRGDVKPFTLTGTDERERAPMWPLTSGIWMRSEPRKHRYVANAIKGAAIAWENGNGGRVSAYAATGLLITPDGPRYLRMGAPALTAAGVDPSTTVCLPPGVEARSGHLTLALDDPSTPAQFADDLGALLRVLDVAPGDPAVPLAMLAQLAWAPWANRAGAMVSVIMAGPTGSRKSSLAGLIVSAQSRTAVYGPRQPEGKREPAAIVTLRHGSSTAIGIGRTLYPLAGMVGLVDDAFATRATPAEQTQQWRTLSLIGDQAATQAGPAKGSREVGSLRPEEYPRACLLVTAERLPDEIAHGSEVARYVAVTLDNDVDLGVLTELQTSRMTRARSRAHAAMIQHGLGDLDAPQRALSWAGTVVESWDMSGHGRARLGYLTLLAGCRLIADAIERAELGSAAWFLDDAVATLRAACEGQSRRAGTLGGRRPASDPVDVFCRSLRELFSAQHAHAADAADAIRPPRLSNLGGPPVVGWRQSPALDEPASSMNGYGPGLQWYPSRTTEPLGAVSEWAGTGRAPASGWTVELHIPSHRWPDVCRQLARVAEWPLPGPDELLTLLDRAGLVAGTEPSRPRMWGRRPHAYTFDLAGILGYEPDDDDQGDDEAPEPEPSTNPSARPAEPAPAQVLPVFAPDGWGACPNCGTPTPLAHHGHQALCAECTQRDLDRMKLPRPQRRAAELLAATLGGPETVAAPLDPEPVDDEPAEPVTGPQLDEGPGRMPARRNGKRRKYPAGYRTGVLDVDGLRSHPGTSAYPVDELPGNIADLVALMDVRELRTLYVHPRAADAMGLDRPANVKGGPDAGHPHPWATPAEGSGLDVWPKVGPDDDRPGLASWMTVRRDGAPHRVVVFPGWETRTGYRDRKPTGFGAAPDGAALLAAVVLFGEAAGLDYYRSPNRTARDLISAHTRVDATSHAVRDRKVPALDVYAEPLDTAWDRAPAGDELGAGYVHRYDRNAAWMHAWSTPLGVGEPENLIALPGESLDYTPATVGWWRVSNVPDGLDPRLPPFDHAPAGDDGAVWMSTPTIELLREIAPSWAPVSVEAWVWPDTRRALDATGRQLREARRMILDAESAGHPGAVYARRVHASLYKSGTGYLARVDGPRRDRETGEAWAGDTLWRPDWRFLIVDTANANLYRQLVKIAAASGRYPLSVNVDAVSYASTDPDADKGRPAGLDLGDGGREWKHEHTRTMRDYLDEIAERGDE